MTKSTAASDAVTEVDPAQAARDEVNAKYHRRMEISVKVEVDAEQSATFADHAAHLFQDIDLEKNNQSEGTHGPRDILCRLELAGLTPDHVATLAGVTLEEVTDWKAKPGKVGYSDYRELLEINHAVGVIERSMRRVAATHVWSDVEADVPPKKPKGKSEAARIAHAVATRKWRQEVSDAVLAYFTEKGVEHPIGLLLRHPHLIHEVPCDAEYGAEHVDTLMRLWALGVQLDEEDVVATWRDVLDAHDPELIAEAKAERAQEAADAAYFAECHEERDLTRAGERGLLALL